MDKKKHKDRIKKVKNDVVNNLEPIVKKGLSDAIDVGKDFIEDVITSFFEGKKSSKNRKVKK